MIVKFVVRISTSILLEEKEKKDLIILEKISFICVSLFSFFF